MTELHKRVEKAICGDIEAYAKIIEHTQHMAYGYAFSILGDFHDAEDASQEAFIEAYRQLPQLKEPKAFLSWFRRILFKQCDRLLRKPRLLVTPLEENCFPGGERFDPAMEAEAGEFQQKIAEAMMQLPQKQREVTTLFYVNGYSYGEISSFLDVPVTTVKKRLHDSRNTLKERMIHMVENGLRGSLPDEHFADEVIMQLLCRPKLLEIASHPIRKAVEAIRSAFPEYEYIEGSEVIEEADLVCIGSDSKHVYRTKDGKYLRPETTVATYKAILGRVAPVHLITAGRVFRPDKEDSVHLKVFHQMDAICVRSGVSGKDMKIQMKRSVEIAAGLFPIRWIQMKAANLTDYVELEVLCEQQWLSVAAGGMLSNKMLRQSGFDTEKSSGFAFGLGLERLAAIKLGISDIRQLWQHPYL